MATYEKSFLLSLYRDMVRIRAFEEHAAECFTKGMLAGNIHLSIGQEAAEAGAFATIEEKDYFTSTHRGHGHAIARGMDPKKCMAELFGSFAGAVWFVYSSAELYRALNLYLPEFATGGLSVLWAVYALVLLVGGGLMLGSLQYFMRELFAMIAA